MNWPMIVLTFVALFSTLVFAISPEEEQRIRNLYENRSTHITISGSYGIIGSLEQVGIPTVCDDYKNPWDAEYATRLELIWNSEVNPRLLITLDDEHHFISPAIIECKIQEKDHFRSQFWLMISSLGINGMTFTKLMEDEQTGGYTIKDVLRIRLLRRNFQDRDELTLTRNLYRDIATDHDRIINICAMKIHVEDTDCEVQNGQILLKNYILRLTATENVVIPGILNCKIVYGNGNADVILYVLDYASNLYRVYEASNIRGKKAYAAEKYLGDG